MSINVDFYINKSSNVDFDINKYYKQRLIMTLYGIDAVMHCTLLFYSFVIGIILE
jgi:hypothetical protein